MNLYNQINSSGFAYDASGNMTNDAVNTYTFDAENRINTAVSGSYCYLYDGDGLRVCKGTPNPGYSCSDTGTHAPVMYELYWRDTQGDTIAETDGSGGTSNSSYNEYVFFAGRRIARSNPSSGNVYYYFADQIGSTRAAAIVYPASDMTDSPNDGAVCFSADYYPYGAEIDFTSSCTINYKFTGYEYDTETGLDYAFARYYNSRLGRMMSGDPLVLGNVSDPQLLNRYTYARSNPINIIDPSGMEASCEPFYDALARCRMIPAAESLAGEAEHPIPLRRAPVVTEALTQVRPGGCTVASSLAARITVVCCTGFSPTAGTGATASRGLAPQQDRRAELRSAGSMGSEAGRAFQNMFNAVSGISSNTVKVFTTIGNTVPDGYINNVGLLEIKSGQYVYNSPQILRQLTAVEAQGSKMCG